MNIQQPNYPPPAFSMTPRDLSAITDLIVHHSDGSPDQTPLEIDQEHRNEGWAMVGYDYIIDGAGVIYKGRPDNVIPSAAYGRNAQSIDVVLLGDFEPGTSGFQASVPPVQLAALKELALYLHQRYPSIVRTIGHRDVATLFYGGDGNYSTACPGDVLEAELPAIRSYVSERMQH